MADLFCDYYSEFLDSNYDCIDRIVLNAYDSFLHTPGGFRTWWRQLNGNDEKLDDTHLMRFAGHFSRRVKAFAAKSEIPLIRCDNDTRKDELIKEHLPQRPDFSGLFCIFVNRASASVMTARRFGANGIDIRKKNAYVNASPWIWMSSGEPTSNTPTRSTSLKPAGIFCSNGGLRSMPFSTV